MLFECVIVVSVTIYLLIIYARWNRGWLERLGGIPVESSHWLVGSNPNFHKMFHHRVEFERNTRLGKVHGVYEGRTPTVFINDVAAILRIAGSDASHFEKRLNELAGNPVASQALEFLTGEKWKVVRGLLSSQFTGAALKTHFPKIVQSTQEAVAELREKCKETKHQGLDVELHEWLSPLLLDMIFHMFFGVRVVGGGENYKAFVDSMRAAMFDGYSSDWTFNWMRVFPFILRLLPASITSPEMTSFRSHVLQLLDVVQLNKKSIPQSDGLLGEILLQMKNDLDQNEDFTRLGITETTIIAQALQFLSASFVGVVGGVKELLWYLVEHPEVAQTILEELQEILHNDTKSQKDSAEMLEGLDFESFLKLKYLHASVLETIRLTPTFARQDRVVVRDWRMTENLQIPRGTAVAVSLTAVHRNAKYWDDPDIFNPLRFLPENKDKLVECSFLGFGVGSRQCPGKRLAILMISIITLQLLNAFRITKSKTSASGVRKERPGLHMTIELQPLHLNFSNRLISSPGYVNTSEKKMLRQSSIDSQ